MMEITAEIRAFIDKAAAGVELAEDEYIDPADGLIHCKKCGGQRQTVVPCFGKSGYFMPRCICQCQREAEEQRKAAEERQRRMERIKRRKAQGLQDRYLYDYTFSNDNGQNPLMDKAHAYVENWKEAYKSNIGLLLFGDVGTGKSFFAGCIANALLDQDVPVRMTNFPTILNRLTGMFSEDRSEFIASFDEYKQKFISQIMTSKSPMRSCDDIDEQALSYAEIKALCAGDPRIREKMDLDVQVAKLKVLRGDFQNQKYRLEDKLLKTFPEEIQKQKTRIAALQQDSQIAAAHPQDKENFCGMTIKGMVYDDKKAAGERLLLARQEMPNADMMLLGTYRGFELNIRFDSFKNEHQAVLRAELSYPVLLGDDARGNITRLDNAIDNFADRIADAENALQNLEQQKQAAEVEVAKPFAQEEELAEKSARLAELNALLNIDRDRSSSQDTPEEYKETEAPATRPSVLAALGEKTNQPEPVKPFRSYYDKDGDAR